MPGARLDRPLLNGSRRVNYLDYLDLASAYAHADWAHVGEPVLESLYPWLLAIAFLVVRPAGRSEFPLARAVNFVIFVIAPPCFQFFWGSLREEIFGRDLPVVDCCDRRSL